MNTNEIWFHGNLKDILELNGDLEKFPEDTINYKNLDAMLRNIQGSKKASVFLYPLSVKEDKSLIIKNWEGNFKDFETDLGNKTAKFEYNEKIYYVYADEETHKKRWQFDFEKIILNSIK